MKVELIRLLIVVAVPVAVCAWFWDASVSQYYRDVFRWRR